MVQARPPKITKHAKIKISDPIFLIFTKNELIWMLIFIIIGSFISFIPFIPNDDPVKILTTLLIFTIIISTSIAAKKLAAPKFAINIEHKPWELKRWGFYEKSYFKNSFPVGLFVPFTLAIFSIGYLKLFTFFQFDAEDIPEQRLLKSHGRRRNQRKEAINEEDLSYTAAMGFFTLIILAIIGILLKPYFPEFGADLTKFSIFFGIWNLLPIGQLDGSKLFFGTTILWTFLVIIYSVSLFFVLI